MQAAKFGAKTVFTYYVITNYIVDVIPCDGPSMLPTLATTGDSVLINRTFNLPSKITALLPFLDMTLHKGDLVVCRNPTDPSFHILKRISQTWTDNEQLPKYHITLLGDNPTYSRDSREYGSVPAAMVEGRVVCRVWPLSKFGVLPPAPQPEK